MKKAKYFLVIVIIGMLVVLSLFLFRTNDRKINQLLKEGESYLEETRYDQAISIFKQIIEISEKSSEARVGLAKCYSQQGKIEDAINELLEAIKYEDSNHEAHYILATLYFNNFKYEEALKEAKKAVQLSPKNVDYRYFAAQMYDRTKRYSEAIKEWEIIIDMDKRNSKYLLPLAGAIYRNGDINKALELLKEISESEPGTQFGQIAGSLIKDIEKKHKNELRLRDLHRELDFNPNNADIYYEMASIFLEEEKLGEAEEAARKAISLSSEKPDYYLLIAKIYDKMNDKIKAVESLEKAAELNPKDYKTTLSLAGFYYQIGKYTEATEKLKQVISAAPESEEAKFAEEKLNEMLKKHRKEDK